MPSLAICPRCHTPLSPPRAGATALKCETCGGSFHRDTLSMEAPAETGETAVHVTPDTSPLLRKLLYGASLPERLVRSGVALTAGAVKELSGLLVPQAFQSSKSYQIAIHDSLEFLTGTIGGVGDPSAGADVAGETVARKAIGNFVDLAGLATLHVSPMWLLAITSDIAYGGRTYLLEVAKALEEQGVIDETSTIHGVDDLLDAIGR